MKNAILISLGFISLTLGIIGIILPIMPTTPFVLLAAACFCSGSPRLYNWLRNTKYFGEFIENYMHKTGVKRSIKIRAITFLWCALAVSAFLLQNVLVICILVVVGIAVTIHISTIKNKN